MFFLSILYSKVQLIGAQHSPDHHARSCRTQIFVSLSFSVLLLLNKIMDNNVYQLSEHAMCNGFSFQFQSRAPFENDLLLFLLSFNLISAHLSVSLVFPPFPFFSPSSNFISFVADHWFGVGIVQRGVLPETRGQRGTLLLH